MLTEKSSPNRSDGLACFNARPFGSSTPGHSCRSGASNLSIPDDELSRTVEIYSKIEVLLSRVVGGDIDCE